MPERGPDGLLLPYPDEAVRRIIADYTVVFACRLPHYQASVAGGRVVRAFTHEGADFNLGPVIQLGVWADDQLVGACSFERDISFEVDEGWGPAWVVQSLFVHPDHQHRGIGTLMLRTLRQLTGLPLAEDTQMSRASADLWSKLRDELGRASDPDTNIPLPVATFRKAVNTLVTDATTRYQEV